MALCFAHAAAGYLAYELSRPRDRHAPAVLAAAVLLANAPDLDFVPGILLGTPGIYHRGVTHTVVAAVVVGMAAALLGRLRGWTLAPWRIGAWAAATYGSHLLLDLITVDVVPPHGAQFLWPLSDAYYLSPVTPIGEVVVDGTTPGAFFESLVAPGTLAGWLADASLLLAVVVAVALVRPIGQSGRREAVDRT